MICKPCIAIKNLTESLANTASYAIKTGVVLVSKEKSEERQKVCQGCNDLENNKCKICLCFIKAKTQLASEKCPKGKW